MSNRNRQGSDGDDKSRDRSRDTDNKQGSPVKEGRPNSNEGPHGPCNTRERDEVRKTGVDAVVATREVMPHLVRKEYSHDRQREGPAPEKYLRLLHYFVGTDAVEVCHQQSTDKECAQTGSDEEDDIQPREFAWLHFIEETHRRVETTIHETLAPGLEGTKAIEDPCPV